MKYFMNESKSDVTFLVSGQSIPALKSNVFEAMFSGNFKKSKDNVVVIEDTTYEAFKTFIRFLYSGRLVIEGNENFDFMEELCKLGDRYEVPRLLKKVGDYLKNYSLNVSDMKTLKQFSRIAFKYKINKLMAKVLAFSEQNMTQLLYKRKEELIEYDLETESQLIKVMANHYRKVEREKKNQETLVETGYSRCWNCHANI